MAKTKIIFIFKKEEEIKKIIEKIKNYSFDQLAKHKHFEFSLMEKMTDLKLIKETFPKFELIKSIEIRENEKKQRYYGFNYLLEDKTFIVLSIVLNKQRPIIINAFHAKRDYEKFEQSLRKNYADKFI